MSINGPCPEPETPRERWGCNGTHPLMSAGWECACRLTDPHSSHSSWYLPMSEERQACVLHLFSLGSCTSDTKPHGVWSQDRIRQACGRCLGARWDKAGDSVSRLPLLRLYRVTAATSVVTVQLATHLSSSPYTRRILNDGRRCALLGSFKSEEDVVERK